MHWVPIGGQVLLFKCSIGSPYLRVNDEGISNFEVTEANDVQNVEDISDFESLEISISSK